MVDELVVPAKADAEQGVVGSRRQMRGEILREGTTEEEVQEEGEV